MFKLMLTVLCILSGSLLVVAQDDFHKIEVYGGYSFERTKGFPGDTFDTRSTISGTTSTFTSGTLKNHNFNGFDASGTYNFSRYVGAKVDASGHFGSDDNQFLPGGTFRSSNGFTILVVPGVIGVKASYRDYRFMGGLQIKDNSKEKKIKPFAHAVFGVARQTTDYTNASQQRINFIGTRKLNNSSFAMAIGGGLDVRVSDRVDIRVIQFEYNPSFTKSKTLLATGATVDSTVTSFTGGSIVTSLQDITIAKRRQDSFRIGIGIVFH